MVLLALTGYLAVVVWGSVTGWPLSVMILSLAYLWEAGVMLMWSTLRSRADLDHVAVGTACLLVGSAFLLFGVAFFLGGAAALRHGWTLAGVPFLLLGVAALLGGVAALLDGSTQLGVAFLLLGLAALLGGVALLYRPELPRRLVAWLTKRDDLPLTADDDEGIGFTWSPE